VLSLLLFLLSTSCVHNPPDFSEAAWRRDVEGRQTAELYTPHFADGKFFNPWMPMEEGGFGRLLTWRLSQKQDYTEEERAYRPKVMTDLKERILAMPHGDFIAWVGHGTFLMRVGGAYWLTDPMFSERALLPKRKTPPAITAQEVGELGGPINVIISHNHYDHFDKKSVAGLPASSKVFVPLGLGASVRGLNKSDVTEMDWWQDVDVGGGVRVVCLPAQHWSRRISQGVNRTLWASFLVITPTVTIYYGGDSGYFIGYREIGKRYPGIDYALLPITAYHPRWFMHYAHVDVQESLDAFQDLGARYFVPTQWGAFHLGDEPVGYPALELDRVVRERRMDPGTIVMMDIGQIVPVTARSLPPPPQIHP
jgi:L-ascorbate metabolism protein UlaG (beta-lactamase superfamily)